MSGDKLVAKQAREIDKLKNENADMIQALVNIRSSIVCIGGPLNDNKLAYSSKQLVTFVNILAEVESVI